MLATFQKELILQLNQNISCQVYNYVPLNASFPYGHLGKIVTTDWSTKTWQGVIVTIHLKLYDKHSSNIRILQLSDQLKMAINTLKLNKLHVIRKETTAIESSTNKAQQAIQMTHIVKFWIKEEESCQLTQAN
ncbi:hypothetical protein [Rickettsiales endosymbiont of Stachyamoeba lipophora]|uniref:hypothetical protein n=1 Tax=Rickettsiales endosymbiont of Stachyamoeba lipophora TaxID=2486578 RepID=UPI000F654E6E|nr:hypothetical protein [Rickettsiales endosymbiont of Stachyamoeba lipophora]AZL15547.1 hypothetical protein EF513_03140 [Rickettsiales endosymbiont of Stachyamoeba lipophora]